MKFFTHHTDTVFSLALLPGSNRFASGSDDLIGLRFVSTSKDKTTRIVKLDLEEAKREAAERAKFEAVESLRAAMSGRPTTGDRVKIVKSGHERHGETGEIVEDEHDNELTYVVKLDRDGELSGFQYLDVHDVEPLSAIEVLKGAIDVAKLSSLVYAPLIAEAKEKLQMMKKKLKKKRKAPPPRRRRLGGREDGRPLPYDARHLHLLPPRPPARATRSHTRRASARRTAATSCRPPRPRENMEPRPVNPREP